MREPTDDRADETVVLPLQDGGRATSASIVRGRYRVERQLGTGGMALVYQVVDLWTGEHLAMKVPRSGSPLQAARLAVEADAMRACRHPHVPAVHDAGEDAGVAYLVFEWASRGSTADAVAAAGAGALPVSLIATWAVQALSALSVVHARGMVHRDVKPANLLIAASGRLLLSDFGVAKVPGVELDPPRATVGSPAFMAPEQVRGDPLGPRADLYAMGATLYALATGHSGDDFRWLPDALRGVVIRAMSADPGDWHADAREMAGELAPHVPAEVWSRNPHLARWAA